jgi:hypothetical protein
MENAQPEKPEAIQSSRLSCDAELFKQSEAFCRSALEAIPELGALAIVPVWLTAPENVPPALLRFRNPNEAPMAGVLQLLKTLASFSQNLNRELVGQFQMFDNYARELAEKIKQNEEKLSEQNANNQS